MQVELQLPILITIGTVLAGIVAKFVVVDARGAQNTKHIELLKSKSEEVEKRLNSIDINQMEIKTKLTNIEVSQEEMKFDLKKLLSK